MPSRNSFSIRKMLVSPRRLSLTVAAGPGSVPCNLKRYSGSSGSSGDSRLSGDTGQESPQSSPDEPSQEEIERIRAVVAAARQRLVEGRGEGDDDEERKEDDETKDDGADNALNEISESKDNGQNDQIDQHDQNDQNGANALSCPRDSKDELALAAQRRWRWRLAGNGNGNERLCLVMEGGGEEGDGATGECRCSEAENGKNDEEWLKENEGPCASKVGMVISPKLTLISTTTSIASTLTTAATTPVTATATATATPERRPKKITKTAKRARDERKADEKREKERQKQEKKQKKRANKTTSPTTPERERAVIRRRSPAPASDTSSCIDLLEALMVQPPIEMANMALGRAPTFTRPRAAPAPGTPASTPTWQTVPPPNKRARRAFLLLRRQRSSASHHHHHNRDMATAVVTTRRRRAWMRAAAANPSSSKNLSKVAVATDEPTGTGTPAAKKQRHSGSTSGSGGSRWTLLPDNVAELFRGRGRTEVTEMLSEEELQASLPEDEEEEPEKKQEKKVETDDAKASENEGPSNTPKEETQPVDPLLPPCAPPPVMPLPPPPHIVLQCKWDEIDLAEDETAETKTTAPLAGGTLPLPPPSPSLSPSPMEPFPLEDLPQRIDAAGVRLSVLLPVEEEAAYFEQQNAARRERERERERQQQQQREEKAATDDAEDAGDKSDEEQDDAKTIRGLGGDVTPTPPSKNPRRYAGVGEEEQGTGTVPTLLVTDTDEGTGVQAGAATAKGKEKQVSRKKKRAQKVAAAAGAAGAPTPTPTRLTPPSSSLRASAYRTTHGHSEEDAGRYVYLHSTPFSMVMPMFRHGPVRLARPEVGGFGPSRRHAHQHQTDGPLQRQDEPLDWTAFQMAILGGAGDLFTDSVDFGHRSAADVEELDDLVAWYGSLGLSEQRLVGGGEEAASETEPKQHQPVSLPLPLPHIVEMPPSEVPRRPPSMSMGLYGRTMMGLRPPSGSGANDRASVASVASVASYDSLPQSPMADVVLTRGADGKAHMAPPMGHNLGHDLGDFLRWETENVYAVALD